MYYKQDKINFYTLCSCFVLETKVCIKNLTLHLHGLFFFFIFSFLGKRGVAFAQTVAVGGAPIN